MIMTQGLESLYICNDPNLHARTVNNSLLKVIIIVVTVPEKCHMMTQKKKN